MRFCSALPYCQRPQYHLTLCKVDSTHPGLAQGSQTPFQEFKAQRSSCPELVIYAKLPVLLACRAFTGQV
jgi:hypothetical protein